MVPVERLIRRFSLPLVLALAVAGPAAAQQEGNFCVRDFTPAAGCNANDVRIEQVIVDSITETCAAGVPGEAEVVLQVLVSADGSPDRYDIGLFIALDGGSARDGDSCLHDYLNPPLTAAPVYGDINSDNVDDLVDGPWWDGGTDDDSCGDIESDTQVVKTLQTLRIACVDTNGDGSIDISVCTSWDNQRNDNCNGVEDAFPSANPKCSCPDPVEVGTPPDAAITVEKTPDVQTVLAGGSAIFTITVESNTFIDNVVIDDAQCTTLTGPVGDDGDGILETIETWTYTCTVTPVNASFTNTVIASGDSPNGPVEDTDTADVIVEAPGIEVQKGPETQSVTVGGTANFNITVENIGNVALVDVLVTDPLCTLVGPAGDTGNDGDLAVGEIWTFTCSTLNVQSGFVNTATATGTPPTGPDVTDSDDATVTVDAPSITVTKNPPTQSILVGDDAVFTITVDNSGDTNLFDVTIDDAQCTSLVGPTGDDGDGVLEVAETWTFTCTVENVLVDFTNVVDVDASTCTPQGPQGECTFVEDSDTADVDVQAPAITVTKNPPTQQVVSGGTANFTIVVDNTGDVPLSKVLVDDPNCSVPVGPTGDTNNDSVLDVTETWSYTCSTANVTLPFTNVVTVTATPPVGPGVEGTDSADVTVVAPDVGAEKVSDLSVDNDGDNALSPGDELLYTIVITNSGDSPVDNMVFTDTPDLNTTLVVGSVTTSQGSVTTGNTGGDTDVSVNVGTLAGGGAQVTIQFAVLINDPVPPGTKSVANQGLVTGDGIPDVLTDDPNTGSFPDPTDDFLTPAEDPEGEIAIPTVGEIGLVALALALGLAAILVLRRRPAARG